MSKLTSEEQYILQDFQGRGSVYIVANARQRLPPHGLDALSQKRPSSMPAKRLTTFIFNEEDITSPKNIQKIEEPAPSVSTMESSERRRDADQFQLNVPLIKDFPLEERPASAKRSRQSNGRRACTHNCCSQENSFVIPTHQPISRKLPLRPTDRPNRPVSNTRGKAINK